MLKRIAANFTTSMIMNTNPTVHNEKHTRRGGHTEQAQAIKQLNYISYIGS